jgi:hypothetical protein
MNCRPFIEYCTEHCEQVGNLPMSFLVNLCARVASLRHLLEPASDWLAWDREASRLLPSRHEMCGAGLLFLRTECGGQRVHWAYGNRRLPLDR